MLRARCLAKQDSSLILDFRSRALSTLCGPLWMGWEEPERQEQNSGSFPLCPVALTITLEGEAERTK